MTPPESVQDSEFEEILARYDERLAHDAELAHCTAESAAGDVVAASGPAMGRLQRVQECLNLLERDRRRQLSAETLDSPRVACDGMPTTPSNAFMTPTDLRQVARFPILRLLGSGGFGVVFLAEDPVLRRLVALKIPRPDLVATPDLQRRFVEESRIAARLTHPNLVPVYEAGEAGTISYQVTEYCSGGTLAELLQQTTQQDSGLSSVRSGFPGEQRRLPIAVAVQLLMGLADGVQHAHEHGILHRDLKPANILLAPASGSGISHTGRPSPDIPLEEFCDYYQARIADFGLARRHSSPAQTETTAVAADVDDSGRTLLAGTPQYMAPEQIDGTKGRIGPATDLFGLGLILYEVLCGQPAFSRGPVEVLREIIVHGHPVPPRDLRPDIPRDLEAICLLCLEKVPALRYSTAGELADDLRAFQRGERVRARHWSVREQLTNWLRRRPAVAALLMLSACLMLGLLGFATWHVRELGVANSQLKSTVVELRQRTIEADNSRRQADDQSRIAIRHAELAESRRQQSQQLAWIAREREYSSSMLRAAGLFRSQQPGDLSTVLQRFSDTPSPASAQQTATDDDPRGFEWRYLWNQSRHHLELQGHSGDVIAAALSADGNQCVSFSDDDLCKRWDLTNGRILKTFSMGPSRTLFQVGVDRGCSRAVTLRRLYPMDLREVCVWDLTTGASLYRETATSSLFEAVAISPDGQRLFIGGHDESTGEALLDVVQIGSGSVRVEGAGFPAGVTPRTLYGVVVSPDQSELIVSVQYQSVDWEHRLFVAPYDAVIRCVNAAENDQRQTLNWVPMTGNLPGIVTGMAVSADGSRLAVAQKRPNQVHVFDWQQRRHMAASVILPDSVETMAFDGKSKLAVAGMFNGPQPRTKSLTADPDPALERGLPDLKSWDFEGGQMDDGVIPVPLAIRSMTIDSPAGLRIIGESGGRLRVIRSARVPDCQKLPGHQPREAWGLCFSPDGRRLYTAGDDGLLRVWDMHTFHEVAAMQQHSQLASCVTVSPDGRWAATGSYDDTVVLWNTGTLQVQHVLSGHSHDVRALAFAPNSQTLASGGRDGVIRLWDVATGALIREIPGTGGTIRALRFVADEVVIEANSDGQVVRHGSGIVPEVIWTGSSELHSLAVAPAGIRLPVDSNVASAGSPSFRTSGHGEFCLVGEKFGGVRLLHVPSGSIVRDHNFHATDIRSVAWTQDGRNIAVAGDQHAVHLLNVFTGEEVLTFDDLPAAVNQIQFSPDSQQLAAALHNGEIRIWHAPCP